MSHGGYIPDDMDEGLPPPPLMEGFRFNVSLDGELEALTVTAETTEDSEIIATFCDTISVFDATDSDLFLSLLLAVIAPPHCGDTEGRLAHMDSLKRQVGSKCRCDAQWYAKEGVENIAFGCKTCAMSSASCICVACFEAGDHEGHDFYISRSDYGCCDCGDIYAWKSSGFCANHSGPLAGDDPVARLDAWTQRLARLVTEALFQSAVEATKNPPEKAALIEKIFVFLMDLAARHDGIRRIIGTTLIAPARPSSYADDLLPVSHLLGSAGRKAWTKLVVDLMLDFKFKSDFATVFAHHYAPMVMSRVGGGGKMSDVGDLTCQAFTRPDVAVRLTLENGIVSTLLNTTNDILESAMVDLDVDAVDTGPAHGMSNSVFLQSLIERMMAGEVQLEMVDPETAAPDVLRFEEPDDSSSETQDAHAVEKVRVLDHAHAVIKSQDAFQSSMDLIYVLDHQEVLDALVRESKLLDQHWTQWLRIISKLQFMNPHRRRSDTHVEFPDPNWSNALTAQGDLMSSFWLVLDAVKRSHNVDCLRSMVGLCKEALMASVTVGADDLSTLFCPLNRVFALTLFELLDIAPDAAQADAVLRSVLGQEDHIETLTRLPMRAKAFHSETISGLWVRNGESVNMETKFYSAPFFHHHMSSADAVAVRLAFLHPTSVEDKFRSFFRSLEGAFRCTESAKTEELVGLLQCVVELMGQQTELALNEEGLVANRATALLAVQPRTFSKLRDAKLERWTSTLMPQHNARLESALSAISLAAGDGPERRLTAPQWLSVDLISPFYSWSEMQVAEERLRDHLRVSKMSISDWFRCHKTVQPSIKIQFRTSFQQFVSSERILGLIIFSLLQVVANPTEFRTLKLVIHTILRMCLPFGPIWRDRDCHDTPPMAPLETGGVTPESLSDVYASRLWCHPWMLEMLVGGRTVSIRSLLAEIFDREASAEMKEWISLVLEETKQQCASTRGSTSTQPLTEEGATPKAEKRRHMQSMLLERLNKRQNAFLKEDKAGSSATPVDTSVEECVICLAASERPMGKLGFVSRSSLSSFRPRPFVPVDSALIPNDSSLTFLPFSRDCGEGRTFLRSCNHAVHMDCWAKQRESQAATLEIRGFTQCPYCNRPANILVVPGENNESCVSVISEIQGLQSLVMRPEVPILKLFLGQIDQLALSLRKPSVETDITSLECGLELIIQLVKNVVPDEDQRVVLSRSRVPAVAALFGTLLGNKMLDMDSLFSADFAVTAAKYKRSCLGFNMAAGDVDRVTELSMLSWLYQNHTIYHYLVNKSHELPFEELLTIESVLSSSDEIGLLVDQFPIHLDLIAAIAPEDETGDLPLLAFASQNVRIIDSFLRREKFPRSITTADTIFTQYFPGLIPVIPSIYQKLYTAYLKAQCVVCKQSVQSVLCLLCGSILCLSRDCCDFSDVGEITHHFASKCAVQSVGVFLQLSNAEVHLISTAGGRTMVAQWGSLFLDSHGEEDSNLSKPLQLNAARLEKLTNELREHSWFWRQGSKQLVWRRPASHI